MHCMFQQIVKLFLKQNTKLSGQIRLLMKLHVTCVAVNSTGVELRSQCLAPTHSLYQSPVCGGTCVKKQHTKVTFGRVVFGNKPTELKHNYNNNSSRAKDGTIQRQLRVHATQETRSNICRVYISRSSSHLSARIHRKWVPTSLGMQLTTYLYVLTTILAFKYDPRTEIKTYNIIQVLSWYHIRTVSLLLVTSQPAIIWFDQVLLSTCGIQYLPNTASFFIWTIIWFINNISTELSRNVFWLFQHPPTMTQQYNRSLYYYTILEYNTNIKVWTKRNHSIKKCDTIYMRLFENRNLISGINYFHLRCETCFWIISL